MINEPHGQQGSSRMESLLDEQYDEWKSGGKSASRKTLGWKRRVVVDERRCEWLMMGERLTNGRTLYGPTSNHQVTDLEHSRQTCVQGPILRSIDGASKRSCNSAIQSLIVQSNSIDPDYPLPLLFSILFIDNAQPCGLRGLGLCTKTCPKLCSTYRQS